MRCRVHLLILAIIVLLPLPALADIGTCTDEDRETAKFWRYYKPEEAYAFGLEIQERIQAQDLAGLFDLVDGELKGGPRKKFVAGKTFREIFPEGWEDRILKKEPPCSPVGWRGFMIASGRIWYEKHRNGVWTIKALAGAEDEDLGISKLPTGWTVQNRLIPPGCFEIPGVSLDGYEEFQEKYGIQDLYDMVDNIGRYFGGALPSLTPLTPSWADSPSETITIWSQLDECFAKEGKEWGPSRPDGRSIISRLDECTKCEYMCERCYDIYSVFASITPAQCQSLAPNFKFPCRESYAVSHGHYRGGTIGTITWFNIYGLFEIDDGELVLLPLKNFRNRNIALNFIDELRAQD